MMLRDLLHQAWPRKNSYSRDVAYTFAANVIIAGLGMCSGILLARALGPAGRGQLAAIQALPLIVGSIGMLGLQDAIVYFGARERQRVGEYAVSATALIFLVGVPIVTASYWLIPQFLRAHTEQVMLGSRIYLAIVFLNAFIGFSIFGVRAVHDMPLWNALRVLPQMAWVLVIVALVVAQWATPLRVAMTYLVALFVASCLALLVARRRIGDGWRVRPAVWPKMLRYSIPSAAGSTPMILGERVDQLIIAAVLPAEQLGYYAVAVSWALLMQLPGAALFGAAFSKIAGMERAADQWRFVKKACWATILVSVAAGAVLCLAAPLVVPWAFGREFGSAVPSAMILVLAGGIRNVARMLQMALKGCGKPSGVMFSEWAGVAVLLGSIGALIPRFGLPGAAWSIVLSGSVASALALVFITRWAAAIGPSETETES